MPMLVLACSVVLLLLLIMLFKLPAYISLLMVAIIAGIASKMSFAQILISVTNGIGNTLGPLVFILCLGALLGAILTETGAVNQISKKLIDIFGVKNVKVAMLVTGFIIGITMFYNAGFVILMPLVFSVSAYTKQPLVYVATAMASALSITHGFLPPHPGPVAIAVIFKADIHKVLLYGIIVAIPALIAAGFILPEFFKKITTELKENIFSSNEIKLASPPSFTTSFIIALLPFMLMLCATATSLFAIKNSFTDLIKFIGDPNISLVITVLLASIFLGVMRGIKMKTLFEKTTPSVNFVTVIILIIAAGGAFRQVLIDNGTATAIANYFTGSSLSPLFLGWLIATVLRICVGSATVAALTAASIVQPLIALMHVDPALMVLSVGAGSLMCSHVNDTGFWMFKEYTGLSVGNTFRTWTVMESVIGLMGLMGVLLLHLFV